MFISMPQEFFVPVKYSDKFRLNEETNQMEYDTNIKETKVINDVNIDMDMVRKLSVSKEGIEEAKKEIEYFFDKSFDSINKVVNALTPEQIKKMNFEQMIDININNFKEGYKTYIKGIINGKEKTEELIKIQTEYSNSIFEEVDKEYIEDIKK